MQRRVFIIGLDGLRGPAVEETDTPNIDRIRADGASSLRAQTVMPSASYQAWGSLFHGVGADKHNLGGANPITEDAPWPSFTKIARQQHPDWVMGAFSSWSPINTDIIEDSCGCVFDTGPDPELAARAADFIRSEKPHIFFIQLDNIDGAGHKHGYRTPEYLAAITEIDALAGQVLAAIENIGVFDDSLVAIVSDHGGCKVLYEEKWYDSHGTDDPDCLDILWSCRGPGIRQGSDIPKMSIMDTPAVAARFLGLPPSEGWDGEVPDGVFEEA